MSRGRLKKVFPGGNTSIGFFSYYDYLPPPEAKRIFVIKGGPGVGKSTFMCSIGEAMLERGYDVEFHCCSSDNGSLDGVVIPSIGIALLDGTAPHVVDPKNPGAVDEIINLGEFWDEKKMIQNRENILRTNALVGKLFSIAYSNLKEAKVILDEWEGYITPAMDFPQVNQVLYQILEELLANYTPQYQYQPRIRHLFAAAITPEGPVHYIDTLLQDTDTLYLILGDTGTGKTTLIGEIARQCYSRGLEVEIYHAPLEPEKVDMVIIPALKAAVVNGAPPVNFDPNLVPTLKRVITFDLSHFLYNHILAPWATEIEECRSRFAAALTRAVRFIKRAKLVHDEMEQNYIPAMDFRAINALRDKTLERILRYAEKDSQ